MASLIEDFRRFSIHDLKRLGMLYHGYKGTLHWKEGEEVVSSIGVSIQLFNPDPFILLEYTIRDTKEEIKDWVHLICQESNLPGCTEGYWMFICPVTGEPCKILYLDDGHFKSRKALPPGSIYKSQTQKGQWRMFSRVYDYSDAVAELDKEFMRPYRKFEYRGKPTRKMRRLMEKEAKYDWAMRGWFLHRGSQ